MAFSKPKQDVWVRLVLAMDGQQEPVRYKAIDYLDKKAIRWPVSLYPFFSGKRKDIADRAKPLLIAIKMLRRAQTSLIFCLPKVA